MSGHIDGLYEAEQTRVFGLLQVNMGRSASHHTVRGVRRGAMLPPICYQALHQPTNMYTSSSLKYTNLVLMTVHHSASNKQRHHSMNDIVNVYHILISYIWSFLINCSGLLIFPNPNCTNCINLHFNGVNSITDIYTCYVRSTYSESIAY